MAVPFSYSLRNLLSRRLTTTLTAGGMALVVFVFAAVLMLAEGLRQTLVSTGTPDNAIIYRKGATSEAMSDISHAQASILEAASDAALDREGRLQVAREMAAIITLPKRGGDTASNAVIRGAGPLSADLRPQVRLSSGRWFRPGSTEVVAGQSTLRTFEGCEPGRTIRFAGRDWTVVGVLDAGSTGFSSEIWGDVDQVMQAFRRTSYSTLLIRLPEPAAVGDLARRLAADPRLQVEVKAEDAYYEEQSRMMSTFLRVLGLSLTLVFSLGAMIGAMITMYSAVAGRTAEIGALRALGFRRRAILWAFLVESLLLGGLGGLVGLGLASFLQSLTISTVNFQTFSELAFRFALTPEIAAWSLAFALVMGLAGGVLPAVRASRMNIVEALRAA